MKISVEDCTRDRWLSIMVMHLMTMHARGGDEFLKTFNITPGDLRPDAVDLRVTINGVEVEFENFVKELELQHNSMLEATAKSLFSRRSLRLFELIDEMEQLVNTEIEESFPGKKVW